MIGAACPIEGILVDSSSARDGRIYDVGSQRALFDIPDGVAYFNTASNAPQLNASRARLIEAAGAKSRPWERVPSDFFVEAESVRRLAAELFGADSDAWAVIPAASYGLSAAARAIEPILKPGDRILVMADEFPSNVLPWRRVAQHAGAALTTVATPGDGDWTVAVLNEIRAGVRVIALSHCHWTNGALLDLTAIGAACRQIGALLVLDVTQSLGAMPLDLATVDPDFMVAAGYKWLLCPYGFGLMYVAPRWRDSRPLEESWLARTNAEDFATLVNYSDVYRPGARRFDVGETCVTTILPGALAALEQIRAWGVARIAASLETICASIVPQLEARGFAVLPATRRAPHMFGATLPDGHDKDVAGSLRQQGVFVSRRGRSIRFAPHLHVTEADLAQLSAALERVGS
jgi:selenocysteine lyase/cysteine desulfurase